jgi:signal recognition particle receptor subunit beta
MKFVDETLYVKLVFFGAAMAGKTEMISYLYNKTLEEQEKTGAGLRQLNTTAGRTLLFDFTTVKLEPGVVARLFSVSGQNYYRGARLHSMQETDGVFLVLDAQEDAMERNKAACEELRRYIKLVATMRDAPVIALINKWEMPNALPMFTVIRQLELQKDRWPYLTVNPLTGYNVDRVFKMMKQQLRMNIVKYRQQHSEGSYFPVPDTPVWQKTNKKNQRGAWQLT